MRIRSKKIITLENNEPVYDITVPLYHNFALSNGCIVHNSKDIMDAIVGSYWGIKTSKLVKGQMTIDHKALDTNYKRRVAQIKNQILGNNSPYDISGETLMNFIKS